MHRCLVVIIVALLAAMASPSLRAADAPPRRPNIVLIVADDLGYADLGVQQIVDDVKTPQIDSIARNGARLTSAYVSAPVCAPSRAGLLTGRYQTRFGFELNPGGIDWPNYGLPLDEVPLPDVLRRAGYHTGMLGKWHLGNRAERAPLARGFDEFFGFWGGLHSYMKQSPGWNMIRQGNDRVKKVDYLTDMIGQKGAEFIDKNHDKPFFLYVAFNAVHGPMQAPEKYLQRFSTVAEGKRRTMLAMLSAMDDAVGQIIGKLREHNLENDTLVIFISDNGGITESNASLNTPFSGYKAQLFEGGIRVPLLVQWKGHVPPGQVLDQPVISLDLFTTAIAAAGAEVPKDRPIDGKDLLPLLTGKQDGPVHDRLFWRFQPQWAVREGNWKLMGLGERAKLFDLSGDPQEKTDVSSAHPDVLKRLSEAYSSWDQQLVSPLWVPDAVNSMDAEEFDRQEPPIHATQRRTRATAATNPS